MARRTRRRPTVVWLPTTIAGRLGVSPAAATLESQSNHGIVADTVGPGLGAQALDIFDIVQDAPRNTVTPAANSLSDIEGSSYRLRRIVGKIFVAVDQNPVTGGILTNTTSMILTAGFIILDVDPVTGAPPIATNAIDPAVLATCRFPWIWRRSWCLSDQAQQATLRGLNIPVGFPFSPNNTDNGSVADGPHVDAKTARIVSDEKRLFLVIGAQALDGSGAGIPLPYTVVTDLRILASMRKMSGNRRNASR